MNFLIIRHNNRKIKLLFLLKKQVLRFTCLKVIIYLGSLLSLPSVFAQNSPSILKVIKQGSSVDSILAYPATKGKVFLSVKTYFSEYSLVKPALIVQFVFDKIDNKGNIQTTYKYTNNLIDFKVNTNIELVTNKPLLLHLDDDRRNPFRFTYQIIYRKDVLIVEPL